jgi:hypothetical protein
MIRRRVPKSTTVPVVVGPLWVGLGTTLLATATVIKSRDAIGKIDSDIS